MREQSARLQDAVTKMIEELDRSHLRGMKADMFRCAATCCESQEYSVSKVERCIQNCSVRTEHAQNYVQQEAQHFQDRINRCFMSCDDKIRDQMKDNPSHANEEKSMQIFEKCATECIDSHISMIPKFLTQMKMALAKHEYQTSV